MKNLLAILILAPCCLLLTPCPSPAQTNFTLLTLQTGRSYTNIIIKSNDVIEAFVYCEPWNFKIPLSNFPPELQKRFHYDPILAADEIERRNEKQQRQRQSEMAINSKLEANQLAADMEKYFRDVPDKFADTTTVSLRKVIRFGEAIDDVVAVDVVYSLSGSNLIPENIFLKIGSVSREWRFLKNHNLIVLYDKHRSDRGEIKHDGDVFVGGVGETMLEEFTLKEFSDMAFAKSVEIKLGNEAFGFPPKSRIPWQVLCNHFNKIIESKQ